MYLALPGLLNCVIRLSRTQCYLQTMCSCHLKVTWNLWWHRHHGRKGRLLRMDVCQLQLEIRLFLILHHRSQTSEPAVFYWKGGSWSEVQKRHACGLGLLLPSPVEGKQTKNKQKRQSHLIKRSFAKRVLQFPFFYQAVIKKKQPQNKDL